MNIAFFLYSVIGVLSIISFFTDREKTKRAAKKAWNMFSKLLPELMAILLFVGLSLSILTPEFISSFIGDQSGALGVVVSTVIGSVALLPSFVVFPLGETLVQNGAGLPQVSALMAALVAVGFASLPMEIKLFGRRFAYMRNGSAVLMSVLFAMIVWVIF
ncbi:hypothetical protein SAMN05421734_106154 [Pelagirhabdus alkalitolerans]|uniref:Permease n=1 Tax=Pelagirhabdus alkalitolerans TaxID=1612202 RepID=A0A1G6KQ53_9BACI|nr:hypothetical protein [Pelagirhabdus alkalitolerans]SDC32655.1 hypothetical protein SAMN05421734_106154 [Pelagirhabdus alkalitolerans]